MKQKLTSHHWKDEQGNPAGGSTHATGLCISWQRGPLGQGEDRQEPNGCFVETVIEAAISRLEFYQQGRFICDENAAALRYLNLALTALENRTKIREARGVEGTHEQ